MTDQVIIWFRRDLRLEDNTALNKAATYALEHQCELIPLFIFDKEILSELQADDKRVNFIHRQLNELNKQLNPYGSSLLIKHNSVLEAFDELFQTYNIKAVFCNEDYEPYARDRDAAIKDKAIELQAKFFSFKDQVIFHKDELLNGSGKPYLVFTPYKNAWLKKIETVQLEVNELNKDAPFIQQQFRSPSLEALGFKTIVFEYPSNEVSNSLMRNYDKTRDIPSRVGGTSKIGIHLRFGTLSIRSLSQQCLSSKEYLTFLSELIWREYFMYILYHFPESIHRAFKPKYDSIPWRNNPEEFELWKSGMTGYPLVDAGMRELNATGYMHNRVRMLVASFLCKHLLIDWRWGEAYFASKLLDYELASNVGNWQWACGSGVDAAPYFRIFNPETQLKKFDPQQLYVNMWVPEFQTKHYPNPMVDHKIARERCLTTYKEALQ